MGPTKHEFPERWCIKWVSRENFDIINSFFNKRWYYESDDIHTNAWSNVDGDYENYHFEKPPTWGGFTEITIEEFKEFVLKIKPQPTPLVPITENLDYMIDLFKKLNIE